jgi:hypothetical protein
MTFAKIESPMLAGLLRFTATPHLVRAVEQDSAPRLHRILENVLRALRDPRVVGAKPSDVAAKKALLTNVDPSLANLSWDYPALANETVRSILERTVDGILSKILDLTTDPATRERISAYEPASGANQGIWPPEQDAWLFERLDQTLAPATIELGPGLWARFRAPTGRSRCADGALIALPNLPEMLRAASPTQPLGFVFAGRHEGDCGKPFANEEIQDNHGGLELHVDATGQVLGLTIVGYMFALGFVRSDLTVAQVFPEFAKYVE